MSSRLIEQWRIAASDLGLDIQIPFSLFLISGACVNADLLLRRFGYTNGMLIITDYSKVAHISAEITEAGYGYSTLSEPRDDENYNRDDSLKCCGTGAGLGLKRSSRIGAPPSKPMLISNKV